MKCLNCSSEGSEVWASFKDIFDDVHHLCKCSSCGVYYLNPFPTAKQLERAYDESYYGTGEKKFNPTVEKVVDWFRQRNARAFARKLSPGATILDIGCGNGSFLVNLGKQGDFQLHGLEPEGKSAERASYHPEIKLHIGYLEESTYPSASFDALVLTHVFEHLPQPSVAMDIITEIARKGAVLQIEIPNIASWQAKIFKGKWLHLDPPRHLNMYPPALLEEELKRRGWNLEKKTFFSPQFSPFGFQQSILNTLSSKREVLYEHLKENQQYLEGHSAASLFIQKLFHWLSFPLFVLSDAFASFFQRGATVKMIFRKK
jgi:2-polyprenyl-3-methyl-5-hydroxy-6-metoxy-1,4-benzoquinol methylase